MIELSKETSGNLAFIQDFFPDTFKTELMDNIYD